MLTVGKFIISELAPMVSVQQAAFNILITTRDELPTDMREEPCLRLFAGQAV